MPDTEITKKRKVSLPLVIAGVTLCFFLLIAIYTFLASRGVPPEVAPPITEQATTTEWARVPSVEELQETLGKPQRPPGPPPPDVVEFMETYGKPRRTSDTPPPDVTEGLPKHQE